MRQVVTFGLVLAVLVAGGCSLLRKGEEPAVQADPAPTAPYLPDVSVANPAEDETPPAVEKYMALLEKHNKAIADMAGQQETNRKLAEENRRLAEQVTALGAEMARAQQELQDANGLLIEVRQQNEKWKTDVLGYRDEMRRYYKALLEAQAKVLKLLGGEVTPEAGPVADGLPETPQVTPSPQQSEGARGETVG